MFAGTYSIRLRWHVILASRGTSILISLQRRSSRSPRRPKTSHFHASPPTLSPCPYPAGRTGPFAWACFRALFSTPPAPCPVFSIRSGTYQRHWWSVGWLRPEDTSYSITRNTVSSPSNNTFRQRTFEDVAWLKLALVSEPVAFSDAGRASHCRNRRLGTGTEAESALKGWGPIRKWGAESLPGGLWHQWEAQQDAGAYLAEGIVHYLTRQAKPESARSPPGEAARKHYV